MNLRLFLFRESMRDGLLRKCFRDGIRDGQPMIKKRTRHMPGNMQILHGDF